MFVGTNQDHWGHLSERRHRDWWAEKGHEDLMQQRAATAVSPCWADLERTQVKPVMQDLAMMRLKHLMQHGPCLTPE
jgi:hypothetical protein